MSDRIDVSITPPGSSGESWSCTIDAMVGVASVSADGDTMADAVDAARELAQLSAIAEARAAGLYSGPTTLARIESMLRYACSEAVNSYGLTVPLYETPPLLGRDVITFPDIDPTFGFISTPRVVAEAVARRLITDPGKLIYDDTYGFDVRQLLNEGLTSSRVAEIQSQIQAQAEQDERVQSAVATVSLNTVTQTLTCKVQITTDSGPFTLVITVDNLRTDISILGV